MFIDLVYPKCKTFMVFIIINNTVWSVSLIGYVLLDTFLGVECLHYRLCECLTFHQFKLPSPSLKILWLVLEDFSIFANHLGAKIFYTLNLYLPNHLQREHLFTFLGILSVSCSVKFLFHLPIFKNWVICAFLINLLEWFFTYSWH